MSIFSLFKNNRRSNARNFKRTLQLESLEERQLLTVAMDMVLDPSDLNIAGQLAPAMADDPVVWDESWETPSLVVNTTESTVDQTDGLISLQEAISYANTTFDMPDPEEDITLGPLTLVDLSEDTLGELPDGESDYVFNIDEVVTLDNNLNIRANGISVVLNLSGDGEFDETNGTLKLTTRNGGRIQLIQDGETLYDSAWEFRGMTDSIEINTTDDLFDDSYDNTDGVISLREAMDNYSGVTYREYANGYEFVTLAGNFEFVDNEEGDVFVLGDDLFFGEFTTLEGNGIVMTSNDSYSVVIDSIVTLENLTLSDVELVVTENGLLSTENVILDGVDIANQGSMTLSGATFTGEFTFAPEDNSGEEINYALISNEGNLSLVDCTFTDITLDFSASMFEDYDDAEINLTAALVANLGGTMEIVNCQFVNNTLNVNAVHGNVNANFAPIYTEGTGEVESGLTRVSRTVIAENKLDAYSKHGDVTATIAGVYAENAQTVLFSTLIYGQEATAATKYGDVNSQDDDYEGLTAEATGLTVRWEDTVIVNSTIIDKISLYRSEGYVGNTIYNETEFVRSGFIADDEEAHNFNLTNLEDWTEIFPFWDAEEGTFTDGNYKIYADNVNIVDAGNNDFVSDEAARSLLVDMSLDLLGSDRVINDVVDIGAVESDAVRLNEESLAPSALAQPDEAGLTAIDFSWGSEAIQSELVTYMVRYKLASDADEDANWTVIDTPFNMNNLPDGVTYDADTMRYTWTVEGLEPGRTLYDFAVFGIGDRIDYLDSADWASTQETTREQIWTPKYPQAAPQSETAITITWVTDPRAVAYEIVYYPTDDPEAVTTLYVEPGDGGVTLSEKKGVWGAAYTINGLEESVGYTINWRSLSEYGYTGFGDDYLLNSDWVSAVTSTKTVLDIPVINDEFENSLTTLDISWTECDGASRYVIEMIVAPDPTVGPDWTDAQVFYSDDNTLGVTGLDEATEYLFRVKATGNSRLYVDSDWSDPKAFSTLIQLDDPELTVDSVFTDEFTTDTLEVSWELPDEAIDYTLYMFDGEDFVELTEENFPELGLEFDGNSVVISGLDASTEYTFQIIAEGEEQVYAPSSAIASGVTPTAVDAPVLEWEDNLDGTAIVTWDEVEHAVEYVVDGDAQDENYLTTDEIDTDIATIITVYARGDQSENYASSDTATLTLQRLEAPENLVAAPVNDGVNGSTQIYVTWDEVDNDWVTGYRLGVLSGNDWTYYTTDDTEFTVTDLTPGTDYTFIVQTLSESGNAGGMLVSEFSDAADAATKDAPYAPSVLVADATGLHQVDLTWRESANADDTYWYVIEAYTADDDALVATKGEDESITGNSFTFTGLDEDTTYYFKIYAFSSDTDTFEGASAAVDSNEDTTWIQLLTPELELGSISMSSIELVWTDLNDSADVDCYRISYTTDTDDDAIIIDVDPEEFSYTVTGLTSGTQYTFTIQAIGIYDRSVDSGIDALDPIYTNDQLAQPANADAVATSTKSIEVTWDAVEGAQFGYTVTCDTLPQGATITVNNNTCTAVVTGLNSDTLYEFEIYANGGTTADGRVLLQSDSAYAEAQTWRKLAIESLAANVEETTVTVTWESPEGDLPYVDHYVWQYRANGSAQWSAEILADDTEGSFEGAINTVYQVRVKAISAQGADGNSEWAYLRNVKTWDVLTANVDAVAAGTQVINVSWNAVPAQSTVSYSLFYTEGDTNEFDLLTWTEVDLTDVDFANGVYSIDVTDLTAETTYSFALFAEADGYIDSDPAFDVATTWAVAPITDNLVITAEAEGQTITVDWDDVDGAVTYKVEYTWTNIAGDDCEDYLFTTDSQAVFEDLEPGVEYTFQVTAYPDEADVDHEEAYSNFASATTDKIQLDSPDGKAAPTSTNNNISVTWDAVDNASGYQVKWRISGSHSSWNTSGVLADDELSFTIENVVDSSTYEIQITALGDGDHYTDSNPTRLTCRLVQIDLDAVVVVNKSNATDTEKPESVPQIDEWTPAFLELWTSDVVGLVEGRELVTTIEINENYEVGGVLDLPGTTVEVSDDGTIVTITVDMEYNYNADDDALLAQIKLTPKSQADGNDDENGIPLDGIEDDLVLTNVDGQLVVSYKDGIDAPKLVKFNDVWITDIVPVIFDLNDDGVIDNFDESDYAAYTEADPDFVDFNVDGKNCDHDLEMLTRDTNNGKSQSGDWRVDYSIIVCTCGDTPSAQPAALPTPAATIEQMFGEEESLQMDDFEYNYQWDQAERTLDLYPYMNENNRMTSGVILKKDVAKKEDSKEEQTAEAETKNVADIMDSIWNDDIDWRRAA